VTGRLEDTTCPYATVGGGWGAKSPRDDIENATTDRVGTTTVAIGTTTVTVCTTTITVGTTTITVERQHRLEYPSRACRGGLGIRRDLSDSRTVVE
jgi:hypothetical protein